MRFGPWEIALILILVLVVFGVGRLPQVGGAMGKAIREFRKGHNSDSKGAAVSAPLTSSEHSKTA